MPLKTTYIFKFKFIGDSVTQSEDVVGVQIDRIIDRYKGRRGALIQILLDVQKENRWLPEEYLRHISDRLNVPLPQVYQVVTFYKAFSLKKRDGTWLSYAWVLLATCAELLPFRQDFAKTWH